MKTNNILLFFLIFLATSFVSTEAFAGKNTLDFEENCELSSIIIWVEGAGSSGANVVYKLHEEGGDGIYYSDYGCQGATGQGFQILKEDGQWRLLDPYDKILYTSDFDSELPPNKGWRVSGGISPAPIFSGNVTNVEVPEVTNLVITGNTYLEQTLTSSYDYSHPSDTEESGSVYKWYTASDTTGTKTLISGASEITYTLTSSEEEKYVQFVVFPFDGSSEGDSVGSNWVGPVRNLEQPVFNTGINNAISFNNNGYVSLNGQSGISAGSDSDDFSIAMWIKTTEANQALFGEFKTGESHTRNYLAINGSGQLVFDQWEPSGGTTPFNTAVNTDEWVHVVYVQESKIRKAYVNGAQESTTASSEAYSGSTPNQFLLGYRGGSSSGSNFSGEMDEVTWWNKALSNSEISGLYEGNINQRDVNLLGYLSFDHSETTTITADVGNTHGSMESGMDTDDRVTGKEIDKPFLATVLSNANSGTVISDSVIQATEHTPSFEITDADTGPFALNSEGRFILTRDLIKADTGFYNVSFKVTLEGKEYSSEAVIKILRSNERPIAENVVVNGELKLANTLTAHYDYSDGDGDEESGSSFRWYSASDTTADKTLISGANDISYKLKASEMGKYIQFVVIPDDGIAEGDSIASAWIGLVTSITTDENALAFDGIDDRVTISDDSEFDFTNGFSAQAWINPSEIKEQVILAQNNGADSGNAFLIKITSSGAISVSLTTTNNRTSSYHNYSLVSSESINAGEWSHIAVRSDNSTVKIFINGSEKGSKDIRYSYTVMMPGICPPDPMGFPMTCPPTPMPSFASSVVNNVSTGIEIGSGNNTQFFEGAIDEVSIWGKALSSSDISNGMNYKRFGDESGLIVYYDFNQGLSYSDNSAINMIEDASDNGIDGTLNNFNGTGTTSNFVYGAQEGTFTDKFPPSVPVANEVKISGYLKTGYTLSGRYEYSDRNNDQESGSTYKWYTATDINGTDKNLISGANDSTYIVSNDLLGKYIKFEVKPNDGSTSGVEVESSWEGPIEERTSGIVVKGNNTIITNGDETPITTDSTDFGSLSITNSVQSISYWIFSTGSETLDINNSKVTITGENSSDFTLLTEPDLTINSGDSTFFTVSFDPSMAGNRKAIVTISNNSPENNPYRFSIQGSGLNTKPVVTDLSIAGDFEKDSTLTGSYVFNDIDGDEESGSTYKWYTAVDTTDTKTAIIGATAINYTLKNTDEGKYIQFVVLPNDGEIFGDSLASKWMGPVTVPLPEIVVKGNGLEITEGDDGPTFSDSTNFGMVAVADSVVNTVYKVFNVGDALLTLGNSAVSIVGTHAADFEVKVQPDSVLSPRDSTKFIIAFDPLDSGNREAQISISSNDADQNPYKFSITGIGNSSPQITGTLANQAVDEDEIIAPFSAVVFEDNETDNISVTVKLDDNFKGNLFSSEFTGVGPYSLAATSVSNAQDAIREITFNPTDNRVLTGESETTRFIITVRDDLSTVTDTITTVLSTAVNEAPITNVTGAPVVFTEGSAGIKVDAAITISDNDNTSLKFATISISNGYEIDQDSLGFINDDSTMGNISGSFNKAIGILTLTSAGATASNEEFQIALRNVFYKNWSTAPKTHDRTVNFSVNDGIINSNEGSQVVEISSINSKPIAENVGVIGDVFAGEILTAKYSYTDLDNDSENGSIYKWYISDDTLETNSDLVSSVTDTSYTIKKADEGKYLQFVVIPNDGIIEGDSVASDWIGPVFTYLQEDGEITFTDTTKKVLVDRTLTIGFNQSISEIDLSSVSIVDELGSTVSNVIASTKDSSIVVAHNAFSYGAIYTLTIPSNTIESNSGERNEEIVWNFKTITSGPIATKLFPKDTSSGMATAAQLWVEFDQPIRLNGSEKIKIIDSKGNQFPVVYSDVSKSGIFGTYEEERQLLIYYENGKHEEIYTAIIDMNGVLNAEGVGNIDSIKINFRITYSDLVVEQRSPSESSSGIAIDSMISAKFSHLLTPYNLSGVTISDQDNQQVSGVTASINDSSLIINHDELKYYTDYIVTIPAGTVSNRDLRNKKVEWSFKTENAIPSISSVDLSGRAEVGTRLFTNYSYIDEGGGKDESTYSWFSADDELGTNKKLITATNETAYSLTSNENGKYISFQVTPNDGIDIGQSVSSSWIGPVILPLADILVQGNGINIEHGSVTTSVDDSTHFGSISITETSVTRNYTIKNTGTDTLIFGRSAVSLVGDNATDFMVINEPSGRIQDGDSATFSIKFDPSVSGVRKATISIANNVAGKNPYTFVIEGIGLNTAPVFTSLDTVYIKENTQIATTLTANDEETPESLLYSLVAENGDVSLFKINSENGVLTFKSIPDYENPLDADKDNMYEVTVFVSDGDKETLQQLKIVVSDENEFAPVFTSALKASVYETSVSGTVITTISATDEDATSSLRYSLITNPQDIFELAERSGELKLKDPSKLDKKTIPVLLVELMVTDGDSSAYQELEVDVLTIPTVVAVSPKADEVSVELDRAIIIKYDQPIQEGSLSEIKITSEGDQKVPNISANIKDSTIVINHEEFMNDTKYTVSIGEGTVLNLDNAGNKIFHGSFTTEKEAPEKVILSEPISDIGSVELSTDFKWEESDRSSSYNFQISEDTLFTENIVVSESNIKTAAFKLSTDLEFYQNYYWRVQGANEDGKGVWSQVAHFVTIAEAPSQIFPLNEAVSISTAPTIQWSSAYEQSTFQVQLATTNSSDLFKIDTTITQLEFLATGLKANTEYSWKARVLDSLSSSAWSEVSNFTTRPDPEEKDEDPVDVTITFGGTSGDTEGENPSKSDKIEVTDYRMVGLPGTDNIRVDAFFKGKYKQDWRAFIETGNPTEFYTEYTPEDDRFIFNPGLGFWVLSTKIVADTYDFTPVKINQNDAYGIHIHPGWNIIANPYRTDVEWKLIQEMNKITGKIYGYDQQFDETDTLKILDGYYFYNDPQLDMDTLFIPYTGFDQRGLKKDTTDRSKGIPNLLIETNDNKNHTAEVKIYYPSVKGKVVDKKFLTSYHPNIEQTRFGMVLKDEKLTEKLKTTPSYFDTEGQKYELELKGERGTKLHWKVKFDELPESGAVLLINKVTQETYLFEKSTSFNTLISESHSKYELYVGDLEVLKKKQESLIPQEFELQPNYPNPFNPSTTINFSLPKEAKVSLIVYDILGRKVVTLVNGTQKAGWHKIYFDGSNLASGVYLYRLVVDKQHKLGKMTLIK